MPTSGAVNELSTLLRATFSYLHSLQQAHNGMGTFFQCTVLAAHFWLIFYPISSPESSAYEFFTLSSEFTMLVWLVGIACPIYSTCVGVVTVYIRYTTAELQNDELRSSHTYHISMLIKTAAHLNFVNLLIICPFMIGFLFSRLIVPQSTFAAMTSQTNISIYYWLVPVAVLSLLNSLMDLTLVHGWLFSSSLSASSSATNLVFISGNLFLSLLMNTLTVSKHFDTARVGQPKYAASLILMLVALKSVLPMLAILTNFTTSVFYHWSGFVLFNTLHAAEILTAVYSLSSLPTQLRTHQSTFAVCLPFAGFFFLKLMLICEPSQQQRTLPEKGITLRDIILTIIQLRNDDHQLTAMNYYGAMQNAISRGATGGTGLTFSIFLEDTAGSPTTNQIQLVDTDHQNHERTQEVSLKSNRVKFVSFLFENIRQSAGELTTQGMLYYLWYMAEMGFNLHYLSIVLAKLKSSNLSFVERFVLFTVESKLSAKILDLYHGRITPGMLANNETSQDTRNNNNQQKHSGYTAGTRPGNPVTSPAPQVTSGLDVNLFFSYSALFELLGKQLRAATKTALEFYEEVSLKSYDIGKLHHIARRIDKDKQASEALFKVIEERTDETLCAHLITFAKALDVLFGDRLKARKMVSQCDLRLSMLQYNSAKHSEDDKGSIKDWTTVLASLHPTSLGEIVQISKNCQEMFMNSQSALIGTNLNNWIPSSFRETHKQQVREWTFTMKAPYLGVEKTRVISIDKNSFLRVLCSTKLHVDISSGIQSATMIKRTCKGVPMLVADRDGQIVGSNPEGSTEYEILKEDPNPASLMQLSKGCWDAAQFLTFQRIMQDHQQELVKVLDSMSPDQFTAKIAFSQLSLGQKILYQLQTDTEKQEHKGPVESLFGPRQKSIRRTLISESAPDTRTQFSNLSVANNTSGGGVESTIQRILGNYSVSALKQGINNLGKQKRVDGLFLHLPGKSEPTKSQVDTVDLKSSMSLPNINRKIKLPVSLETDFSVWKQGTYCFHLIHLGNRLDAEAGSNKSLEEDGSQGSSGKDVVQSQHSKSLRSMHFGMNTDRKTPLLVSSSHKSSRATAHFSPGKKLSGVEASVFFAKVGTGGFPEVEFPSEIAAKTSMSQVIPSRISMGSRPLRSAHTAASSSSKRQTKTNKVYVKEDVKRVLREGVRVIKQKEHRSALLNLDNFDRGSSVATTRKAFVAKSRSNKRHAFKFVWAAVFVVIFVQVLYWIAAAVVRWQMSLSLDSEILRLIDKRYSILNWLSTDSARRYTVINVMQELLQRKGLLNFTDRYKDLTQVEKYNPVEMLVKMTNVTVYYWNGLMRFMQTFKPEDVQRLSAFTSKITINKNEQMRTDASTSFTYDMASMDMFKMSLGITDTYYRLFVGQLPDNGQVPALDLNSSKLETVEWLNTNEFLANMTVRFVSSLLTTDETTYLTLVSYVEKLVSVYYAFTVVALGTLVVCAFFLRSKVAHVYKIFAKVKDWEIRSISRGMSELDLFVEGMVNMRSEYPKAQFFNLKKTHITAWDRPHVNDLVVLKSQLNRGAGDDPEYLTPMTGKIRVASRKGHLSYKTWFGVGLYFSGIIVTLAAVSASYYFVFTSTSTDNKYELRVMFINRSVGRILFTGTAMILKVYVSMLAKAGLRKTQSQVNMDLVGYTNMLTNFDDNLKMATAFFNQNPPELLEKAGFNLLTQPPCQTLGAHLIPVSLEQCENLAGSTMKIDWITTYRWLSLYFHSLLDKLKKATTSTALSVLVDPTFVGVEALYHGMLDYLPPYTYNFYNLLYAFHEEVTFYVRSFLVRLIWVTGAIMLVFNFWRLRKLKESIHVAVSSLHLISVECVTGNAQLKAQMAKLKVL